MSISRRNVIRGTVGMAAAGPIASVALSNAQARIPKWDRQADIVVVGSGAAGMTAAVCACSNGDRVLVLERAVVTGGTTAKSAGVHWIPNNFILRAKGVSDNRNEALAYMIRTAYPADFVPGHPTLGVSQERFDLLAAFYDNASPMVDKLHALGIYKAGYWNFAQIGKAEKPQSVQLATETPDYAEHLVEDRVPVGRGIGALRADGTMGSGADLIEYLEAYLRYRKQLVLTDHTITGLLQNKKREVVGVVALHAGKTVHIRARKAVIFGTGGYAHNESLRRRFQRVPVYGSCAAGGSQGDFIAIAGAAGAALGNMDSAWRSNVLLEHAIENHGMLAQTVFAPVGDSMILVNRHGKRVVNEFRSYNSVGKTYSNYDSTREEYPNQVMLMIFDSRTLDLYGGNNPIPAPDASSAYMISGANFSELATNIDERLKRLQGHIGSVRLDDGFSTQLASTVSTFNEFARSGLDLDFGRGNQNFDLQFFRFCCPPRSQEARDKYPISANSTMYPFSAEGPYYAFTFGRGVLDTNGGPVINAKAQVVDYCDRPIQGLYGAGNCIASPTGEAYFGVGGTIGPAMTFGYIAANAARDEPVKAYA